ncbi:MAG: NADH:flavin oxidoreductase/NADH oxidase [Alphaproteobacteria bacterium]|nr:NADH:flavin oxidoreductase/NADH oxidase [Alphaproteobacteria bacterium]
MPTPKLFEPIAFRSVTARNRIALAPLCQYCATDGLGDDWHIQHLGARAMGGAGIVFTEATHVSAVGRITPGCLGLYNDEHEAFLARVVKLIVSGGAVPGIQLAHAGRKASTSPPYHGGKPIPLSDPRGWQPIGPSAIAFGDGYTLPEELSPAGIADIIGQFATAAARSRRAGFKVIELHGAHGYLGHSFLSPISNRRTDAYGGDLTGRSRFLFEMIEAVRGEWPDDLPLFVRLSSVDWMEGGIQLADTVELARRLKATGHVDLIDCSSGGGAAVGPKIPSLHPGYQVPFAEAVKHQAGLASGAVGLITAPEHAAEIIANNRADIVLIGRAMLADPAWPLRAAKHLGAPLDLMPQYQRATMT